MPSRLRESPASVFICYAPGDQQVASELGRRLRAESWIDPWLAADRVLPGQNRAYEIERAIKNARIAIVLLSRYSVAAEGEIQKEIRVILDTAKTKPEGTVFVIPIRLDACKVPYLLADMEWIDFFPSSAQDEAFNRLMESLAVRANRPRVPSRHPPAEPILLEPGIRPKRIVVSSDTKKGAQPAVESHPAVLPKPSGKPKQPKVRRQLTTTQWIAIFSAVIGLAGVILAALIGLVGDYITVNGPINATRTAEAAWLPTGQVTPTSNDQQAQLATPILTFGSHWTGEYYANDNLSGEPVATRDDPLLDFIWNGQPPVTGLSDEYWSARWQTRSCFKPGPVYFFLHYDDALRLIVEGSLIYDDWTGQKRQDVRVQYLVGQTDCQTITVEFRQFGGGSSITVGWIQP